MAASARNGSTRKGSVVTVMGKVFATKPNGTAYKGADTLAKTPFSRPTSLSYARLATVGMHVFTACFAHVLYCFAFLGLPQTKKQNKNKIYEHMYV